MFATFSSTDSGTGMIELSHIDRNLVEPPPSFKGKNKSQQRSILNIQISFNQ